MTSSTDERPGPGARLGARLAMPGAALLLILATAWAYGPVLDNGFVWDDGANLIAARAHWDRGIAGLAWGFTTPFFGHYQPLTWMSYQLDVLLSGATPRGVHATNLALHLLASGLVGALGWWFARRLVAPADGRSRSAVCATAGLLGAALFALHPIRVETVAWATERRDVLSTVLVLAAVLLHLATSPADTSPARSRWGVALLHALAALARAQMSLPFVLLALDLWPLGRMRRGPGAARSFRQLLAEKSLSFAVAGASAVAALWAQASSGALTAASEHGLAERLVQTGYSLAFYPAALVYRPHWLPLYERPYPFDPFALVYLAPALAALAVCAVLTAGTAIAAQATRASRGSLFARLAALAVAFGTYALLVLPVSGLAQSGIQLVAERYAYLSTVPLVLLAGVWTAKLLHGSAPRPARLFAGLALLVLLAVAAAATRRQTAVWRSDETLWRHVLAHAGSGLADNNLGQLLFARGESGEALLHLVRCLERLPLYSRPWRAIAAILEAPWPAQAPPAIWVAATLERAAALQPGSTVAAYTAGLAWLRADEPERARDRMRQVLDREPGHEGARLTLAGIDSRTAAGRALTAPTAPARP